METSNYKGFSEADHYFLYAGNISRDLSLLDEYRKLGTPEEIQKYKDFVFGDTQRYDNFCHIYQIVLE